MQIDQEVLKDHCPVEDKPECLEQIAFTGDPINNPFDRIRILCTDTDNNEILVPQDVIEFLYQECNQDQYQTAAKALTFLMVQIAKMGDEKVGGVYLKNSDRIKNMRLVLDSLKADLLKNGVGSAYAGGISKADIMLNRWNPGSPRKGIEFGDATNIYGSTSTPVGVAGSRFMHESPVGYDIPDGCILMAI